jgi:integrase
VAGGVPNGVKTRWRRQRKAASVVGFQFHDYRHDIGTKVLRKTGNLKLVQKMVNHADIRSTMRYAIGQSEDPIGEEKAQANAPGPQT